MKSYRQYCALARALDVVGERWSLLIVRELAFAPRRYTDLLAGLPGIATNLLADRLRALEQAGVIQAEAAPPPVATTLYSLTDWGRDLWPILVQLGRWGAGLLGTGCQGDHASSQLVAQGAVAMYHGTDLSAIDPVTVLVDVGGRPALLTIGPGGVTAAPARQGQAADITLATGAEAAVALLAGHLPAGQLDAADRSRVRGSDDALRRFATLAQVSPRQHHPDSPEAGASDARVDLVPAPVTGGGRNESGPGRTPLPAPGAPGRDDLPRPPGGRRHGGHAGLPRGRLLGEP